jgi:hypothetical protein
MYRPQFSTNIITGLAVILLALAACSPGAVNNPAPSPQPPLLARAGPSWTPQAAIAAIDTLPFTVGDRSWNAEFDPYQGRWEVTLIYTTRNVYPPRDERKTILWYVYEDTGEVQGPFQ